jgi:hypothetical protein
LGFFLCPFKYSEGEEGRGGEKEGERGRGREGGEGERREGGGERGGRGEVGRRGRRGRRGKRGRRGRRRGRGEGEYLTLYLIHPNGVKVLYMSVFIVIVSHRTFPAM